MDTLLPLLALLALLAGGLTVLIALVLALVTGLRRPAVLILAIVGAALTVIWMHLTTQAGIRADETQTSGNIFSDITWLVAAVVSSSASLILNARTHQRRHRTVLDRPSA